MALLKTSSPRSKRKGLPSPSSHTETEQVRQAEGSARFWQQRCQELEARHQEMVEVLSGYAQIEVIPAIEAGSYLRYNGTRHVVSPRIWTMLWAWFQCHKNTTVEMPVGERMTWRGTPVIKMMIREGREVEPVIDVEWWEDLTQGQVQHVLARARHLLTTGEVS